MNTGGGANPAALLKVALLIERCCNFEAPQIRPFPKCSVGHQIRNTFLIFFYEVQKRLMFLTSTSRSTAWAIKFAMPTYKANNPQIDQKVECSLKCTKYSVGHQICNANLQS